MYMVMFVLDDNNFLNAVLKSWSELSVTGATIIESTGKHRHLRKRIPMRYIYGDTGTDEVGNTTLFTIVENEAKARACLKAVEEILGDLNKPNTGVFSAWPLAFIKGIKSPGNKNKKQA